MTHECPECLVRTDDPVGHERVAHDGQMVCVEVAPLEPRVIKITDEYQAEVEILSDGTTLVHLGEITLNFRTPTAYVLKQQESDRSAALAIAAHQQRTYPQLWTVLA